MQPLSEKLDGRTSRFFFRLRISFVFFLFFLPDVSRGLLARELRIAVAGSYLPRLTEIKKEFEKKSPYRLRLIAGSTGSLYTQIRNGAPFDAFLAADLRHPVRLIREGRAEERSLFIYERGRLALWSKKRFEAQATHLEGFLTSKKGYLLAIPNPALAPYGRAAREFLTRRGLWKGLAAERRLLWASGVSQSFAYVQSGAADLGFVSFRQLAYLPSDERAYYALVPESEHTPILQAGVLLASPKSPVREFWKFFQKSVRNETPSLTDPFLKEGGSGGALQKKEAQTKRSIYLSEGDVEALRLSLELAGLTSLILLVVASPLAWLLSLVRWPPPLRPLRAVLDALVALPLVLPPTVLGFYLLLLLGKEGPLSELSFAFSFGGILFASCLYSLPFAVQALRDAFLSVGSEALEAAASLGAGPVNRFFTVVLPLSRVGYLSAAVLSFAHTLGEFGVVLMIGGSIPGKTRLASIAIFEHAEALDYGAAHGLSLALLGISFFLLVVVYALRHQRRDEGRP